MIQDDDWRLQGRERYLKGVTPYWREYSRYSETWDHDHCAFCWAKFCVASACPDSLQEGYATEDNYRWICEKCFEDFKEMFEWDA